MRNSIKSIQFLRFVAASLVVFSHTMLAIDVYFKGSASRNELYSANFGGLGVHIFFVISGFIMVYTSFNAQRNTFSASLFLLRRFCRIFPIFWLYCLLYLGVHQMVLQSYGISLGDFLLSLLLIPGYSALIIGPAWTLSFEVYFYACFALFMILGLQRGLLVITLYFLASIAVGFGFHSSSAAFHVITDSLLTEFLAGAWIAYLFLSGTHVGSKLANVFIFLGLVGFLCGLAYGYHRLPSLLMWGIPSAFLIAGLVFRERTGHLGTTIPRLSFLGDSSYSLYLLHILLIDLLFKAYLALFSAPGSGYVVICLLVTVICISVAYVSYELIERWLVATLQSMAKSLFGPKMEERVI